MYWDCISVGVVVLLLSLDVASRRTTVSTAAAASPSSYDYVVVGGGSTGSVVGKRLANAGFDVLILEAGYLTQSALGGRDGPLMKGGEKNLTVFDVPAEWLYILEDREMRRRYEWNISSPQGQTGVPAQARGLGGCGIHNAMIYIRGTPSDFAPETTWGRMNWTWDRVLPAYVRSENNTAYASSPFHGTDGPVQISFPATRSAFAETFLRACEKASGLPRNEDFNGATREGCGAYQFLVRDGVRDSTAVAFLARRESLLRRRDPSDDDRSADTTLSPPGTLRILDRSVATRVLIDEEEKSRSDDDSEATTAIATAVEYVDARSGETRVVRPKREIVLSCGAVHTPKLLLRSGIGAPARVAKNRSVVVELPDVGENLMDGVYLIMQFAIGNGSRFDETWEHCWVNSDTPVCNAARSEYASNRSGIFASPGLSVGGFFRSPYASNTSSPDVQITLHSWDKYSRTNWTDAQRDTIDAHGGNVVTFEISFNSAGSTGRILLSGNDEDEEGGAPAVFDGPYLKDGQDALPLLWATNFVRGVMRQSDAASTELLPGPHMQNATDLIDYVRCGAENFRGPDAVDGCDRSSMIVDHLCCSARMGKDPRRRGKEEEKKKKDDETGVVDERLRVHGVRNLRVADASVFPVLPSGNSHASCMMVGERAAEFLVEDAEG